jgi:hypothetical protein
MWHGKTYGDHERIKHIWVEDIYTLLCLFMGNTLSPKQKTSFSILTTVGLRIFAFSNHDFRFHSFPFYISSVPFLYAVNAQLVHEEKYDFIVVRFGVQLQKLYKE